MSARIFIIATITASAAVGCCTAMLRAAEIHFHPTCRVEGGLVLLGDLADIYDANPEEAAKLKKIDLMPAPAVREKRVVRAREVQDLLNLRGVNPTGHRFTGASQVTITSFADAPAAPTKKATYLNVPLQQVTACVRKAVEKYLDDKTGNETEWQIKFDLKTDQAIQLAPAGDSLTVDGGQSPWTGLQNLTLAFESTDGPVSLPLSVQVTPPPSVVVTTQALPRGAIIKATDVRLQTGKTIEGSVYVYTSLDEVVGKEASRALVEGQILDEQVVKRPLLVERGDVITVYARTSGLRVRTTARAVEAGGEGDLIRVESMTDRKSYYARVSGPQEVEVYAHAQTASSESASRPQEQVRQARHTKRLPPAPLPPESAPVATK